MEALAAPVQEILVDPELPQPGLLEAGPDSTAGIVLGTVLIFLAVIVGGMVVARERRSGMPRPRVHEDAEVSGARPREGA